MLNEKRIISLFKSNSCFAAVAGVDNCVVGQGKKLFAYGHNELSVVAVGEIGATYAILEKRIAAKKHPMLGKVKCKAAGRVAGHGYRL